jgi:hypothetical protein
MLYKDLKILSFIFACVITTCSFAQTGNYQLEKIAPALLRQDLSLLRDTMQKIHPGLYVYKSKATIDRMFDSCFATIQDSMTVADFYALTRFVIASIGDGHTNCRLSNQVIDDYYNNVKVFPAMIMFIHNRAFVFCCKQNTSLTEVELLAINNHSLKEIIQRLFMYVQSDGFIQSHKNWELPEDFQLLYNILYGANSIYSITYKTKSGEIKHTTLQADIIKNVFCTSQFPRPTKYLQLTYKPTNIAVLTIKSFYNDFLKQNGENFITFLDSAFTDIKNKKVHKLLIDIRSNQGGNDENGELLYSYLTSKSFMYYADQSTIDDHYMPQKHPELAVQKPKENNFKGKVCVLVNGRSFSASAEFSSIVKTNDRGKFIGEECGGGYYGNTSGAETYLALPNTQITARIPMVKYTMAVKKIGTGVWSVKPDYPVYTTISDIVEKKDRQLDYSIDIIKKL